MKILVVSLFFYPDLNPRAFRTTELVKELSKQGHEVTLFVVKNESIHNQFEKEHHVTIKDLGKLKFRPISINRFGKYAELLGHILKRLLLMLFEYPLVELVGKVNKALKDESGYDLLISVAVPFPIHWGVAKAMSGKGKLAKVWVADCGDPYMGDTNDSFRKLFYFKYVEKWFCRKADYISVPRIEMKVNYYSEFHHKIVEIPQGFNFDEIKLSKEEPENKYPVFAFAGGFFRGKRDPSNFLNYLCSLNIDFKFVVYTQTPELLVPYKDKLGEKLEIRQYLPREEILRVMNKMDFLINIGYDPALQSPSKLIDYHLSGRPVLSFNPEFNEMDKAHFREFLKKDYSNQLLLDNLHKFDIKNVARQFTELVKS
jgi:glycosyltransferase involved in cell wall biosynthesis